MSGSKLAYELLDAAKSDLKALTNMMEADAFDDRIFGFHAQQAVEKSLKAWLHCLQGSHPFTHDLSLLLHSLEQLGQDVEMCWGYLDLSGYAVRFRYESLAVDEEPLDRDSLVEDATRLIDQVEMILASD